MIKLENRKAGRFSLMLSKNVFQSSWSSSTFRGKKVKVKRDLIYYSLFLSFSEIPTPASSTLCLKNCSH